jgi:hypothetical protein
MPLSAFPALILHPIAVELTMPEIIIPEGRVQLVDDSQDNSALH